DLDDVRSEYRFDLNEPVTLPRKFDVITNFGTLEHVFNPASVVKCMHDHLETGGLGLHVLPTRGDYNHGFYNIHSTWFRDLAAANRSEIVDMVPGPDFGGQHHMLEREEKMGEGLPRRSVMIDIRERDDDTRDEFFARTVSLRLLRRRWFDKKIDPR